MGKQRFDWDSGLLERGEEEREKASAKVWRQVLRFAAKHPITLIVFVHGAGFLVVEYLLPLGGRWMTDRIMDAVTSVTGENWKLKSDFKLEPGEKSEWRLRSFKR